MNTSEKTDPYLKPYNKLLDLDYNYENVKYVFDMIYRDRIDPKAETGRLNAIFKIRDPQAGDQTGKCPDEPYYILQQCLRNERPELDAPMTEVIRNFLLARPYYVNEFGFEALALSQINVIAAVLISILSNGTNLLDNAQINSGSKDQEAILFLKDKFVNGVSAKYMSIVVKYYEYAIIHGNVVETIPLPEIVMAACPERNLSQVIGAAYLPDGKIIDCIFDDLDDKSVITVNKNLEVNLLDQLDKYLESQNSQETKS